MALFRCNTCNYLREVPDAHVGKVAACPVCQQPDNPVHETVGFATQLLQRQQVLQNTIADLQREIVTLKQVVHHTTIQAEPPLSISPDRIHTLVPEDPARHWFAQRQIAVTTHDLPISCEDSFQFIALELGDHYAQLQELVERICNAQSSGRFVLNLGDYSHRDAEQLKRFCVQLHSHSLISRYSLDHTKTDMLHVFVKHGAEIASFFAGEWLEWFMYAKISHLMQQANRKLSCLKNYSITWPDGEKNDLSLFFLLDDKTPLLIECKANDYRSHLQKLADLRRRLKLERANFVLLVAGLDQEIATGMSNIFAVTVANENQAVTKVLHLLNNT